jgi:hypothetical protein
VRRWRIVLQGGPSGAKVSQTLFFEVSTTGGLDLSAELAGVGEGPSPSRMPCWRWREEQSENGRDRDRLDSTGHALG